MESVVKSTVVDIVKTGLSFLQNESAERIFEELELDSMCFMTIVLQIENRFGIEFGDENLILDKFRSVDALVSHIEGKLEEKSLLAHKYGNTNER